MCEPHHSTVQFPSDDSTTGSPNDGRLHTGLGTLGKWLKKVGSFFHLSSMGSGHSESVLWAKTKADFLPNEVARYETEWWNRGVRLDGRFKGTSCFQQEALEAAERYSWAVSIGGMTQFRRFFEASLLNSERPQAYIDRFIEDMIRKEKRDETVYQLKAKLNRKQNNRLYVQHGDSLLTTAIKVMLGITRQRSFLVPEWSDDDRVWNRQSTASGFEITDYCSSKLEESSVDSGNSTVSEVLQAKPQILLG